MKGYLKLLFQPATGIILMSQAFCIYMIGESHAQGDPSVSGKLVGQHSNQSVPFANVYLMKASDSTLINGTISDSNGIFKISPVFKGSYRLYVSAIGYQPAIKRIDVADLDMSNAGTIFLEDTAYMLGETVIVGDRLKAKSEKEKTTFYVTKSMLDVSNNGIDILKLIPGIQVDILHHISLDGSRDMLVFVDGKERDRNFISQLNPKQIDKVEVIRIPPSSYEGNITGAINIILKKERDS